MKVLISVHGKFHAFYLARELQERGSLEKIITSYPRYRVREDGLDKDRVVSFPIKVILQKIYGYFPHFISEEKMSWYLASFFDWQAAGAVTECDIFVGWSGATLLSLRKAKFLGATTVVERCSSHIEYQREILRDEYGLLGLKPRLPFNKTVERELREYREADFISIPSTFVRKSFLDKGIPEQKLICVPYGVDAELFKPVPKTDNIFRVVFVGNLSIRKGVHHLLKAVSELKLKNFQTWLIGPLSREIAYFLKKYEGSYRYFGKRPYRELCKYYSYGSVFVISSLEEGLAYVIPQAMACGLPVICTPNTGGADVVRDGVDGYIIPIRDVNALKEKILYYYEHQDICREMGRQARERVVNNFTWKHYADAVVEEYRRMCKIKTNQ